jgi:hypothetical protein
MEESVILRYNIKKLRAVRLQNIGWMKELEDMEEILIGLLVGFGIGITNFGRKIVRPFLKSAIKGGLAAREYIEENLNELVAEARQELRAKGRISKRR